MSRLPLAFFTAAALCAVGGMIFGIVMASSGDFTLMPAHAHLNLVGWASLALMGAFYQLSGAGGRVGWINFWLSTVGVVIMIPSLSFFLLGKTTIEPVVEVASVTALLGMLTFLSVVLSQWKTPRTG
jgi:hypothetical protein